MSGSPVVAAWIAHLAFWVLLVVGYEELGIRRLGVFVAAWLAGYLGLPHIRYGGLLFAPFVALLDVVLVLIIFKGDVRLR